MIGPMGNSLPILYSTKHVLTRANYIQVDKHQNKVTSTSIPYSSAQNVSAQFFFTFYN